MKKIKIFFIWLIGLLTFIVCFIFISILSNKPIEIPKENLNREYAKLTVGESSEGFKNYTITIDGISQTFELSDHKFYSIYSLCVVDLNDDSKLEIMVSYRDNSISPSYRTWSVYRFNTGTKQIIHIMDIYDGEMVYNKLFKVLKVTHQLHETAYPMYETNYYTIR